MYGAELQRLVQSLEIAAVLGDAEHDEVVAASLIAAEVRQIRVADLDRSEAWIAAITWALQQLQTNGSVDRSSNVPNRSLAVGEACKRLREQGYRLSVQSYGVDLLLEDQWAIVARIEALMKQLGGVDCALQVCGFLANSKLIYDGMWLLGNTVPNVWSKGHPLFPVGWIFSLSLKHLGSTAKPANPGALWSELARLAIDFAACLNCQRYSQFEEIDVQPHNSWQVLRDSLLWREIFVLPQVSRQVIPALRDAFRIVISQDEFRQFDVDIALAFSEVVDLLRKCKHDVPTLHSRGVMQRSYPNLYRMGLGEPGQVNPDYGLPTDGGNRNQSHYIFFGRDAASVISLPAPLLTEAFCQLVFVRIWSIFEKERAKTIVGKIFEEAIVAGCRAKTTKVSSDVRYSPVKNLKMQIDVATRNGDRFVLLETKGKSLTSKARSGDMMMFYKDYCDSYLSMVLQLVRHEKYLRDGVTPLTDEGEDTQNLRPLKVAVSPLSYGPVGDKMLASSLLRCFAGIKLVPLSPDDRAAKTTNEFNKLVRSIFSYASDLAPFDKDGNKNVFAYLLDLFWLDLGQLLYALDRGNSVESALRPFQFMTFATRDILDGDRIRRQAGDYQQALASAERQLRQCDARLDHDTRAIPALVART